MSALFKKILKPVLLFLHLHYLQSCSESEPISFCQSPTMPLAESFDIPLDFFPHYTALPFPQLHFFRLSIFCTIVGYSFFLCPHTEDDKRRANVRFIESIENSFCIQTVHSADFGIALLLTCRLFILLVAH